MARKATAAVPDFEAIQTPTTDRPIEGTKWEQDHYREVADTRILGPWSRNKNRRNLVTGRFTKARAVGKHKLERSIPRLRSRKMR